MKRIFTTLAFLTIFFGATVKAQQWSVPEENKGLLVKITGSWCTYCGLWGWDAMDSLVKWYDDDHIIMGAYVNDYTRKLSNPGADFLADEIGYSGTPNFSGNGQTVGTSWQQVSPIVEAFAAADTVFANSAFEITNITCDTINLKLRTKFFEQMPGKFLVKAYLIEDHVIEYQKSQSDSADHHYVLRGVFTTDSTDSDTVTLSGANQNDQFEKLVGIGLDTTWNVKHFKIAATLWMVNPDDAEDLIYVNGTDVPQEGDFTGCSQVEEEEDEEEEGSGNQGGWTVGLDESSTHHFEIYPNPASDYVTVSVGQSADFSVEIMDLLGKTVLVQSSVSKNSALINLTSVPSGLYMISIETENGEKHLDRIVVR
ncbi:MAG: T9SS type A sorting domain-containing protein [Flavobacteriales bacterium]